MNDQEDLIVVAHIAKVRGLRGEVVADLLTDFPDRFEQLSALVAVSADGSPRSLQIEEHWFHGDRLVLKFAGFDQIESAKELVGCDLAVPADERVELPGWMQGLVGIDFSDPAAFVDPYARVIDLLRGDAADARPSAG